MRPVDADKLLKASRRGKVLYFDDTTTDGYTDVLLAVEVERAPTIEAEPVRHGKWLDCDYKKLEHGFVETYPNAGKYCSNCRTGFKKEIIEGYIFCPYCGARMDGGENIP